jgi:hypothetical protein
LLIRPLAIESLDMRKQLERFLPLPFLELPIGSSSENTDDTIPVLWSKVIYTVEDVVRCLVALIRLLSTFNDEAVGLGYTLVANLLTVHKSMMGGQIEHWLVQDLCLNVVERANSSDIPRLTVDLPKVA